MPNISVLRKIVSNGWTIANRRTLIKKIGEKDFNDLSQIATKSNIGKDTFEYSVVKSIIEKNTLSNLKEILNLNFENIVANIRKQVEIFKLSLIAKPKNKMTIQAGIDNIEELKYALGAMVTEFDTKDIILARLKSLVAGNLKISSSKLGKDSTTLEILKRFSQEISSAGKNRQLVIVTGRAASGKSTYIKKIGYEQKQFLIADADVTKEQLPGYEEFGSSFVHTLSASLNRAKLSAALDNGCDIIYPTTGLRTIIEIIEKAKGLGYKSIKVVHFDTPIDVCAQRAVNRFKDYGRFVDPYYIKMQEQTMENIIGICKEMGVELEKYISA